MVHNFKTQVSFYLLQKIFHAHFPQTHWVGSLSSERLYHEELPSDLVLPETVTLIISLLTHTFLSGRFYFVFVLGQG